MTATVTKSAPDLTSGRLLARNTIWNLLGQMAPMAVGVVAIPPLIHGLGVARFGLLSLAWIVIGYFSLFDLGVGRALTKLVADKLGSGDEHSIPPLAWTSLLLMLLFGVVGSAVALAISPWLVQRALKIPLALQSEALKSFLLLGFSIPIVTVTSGFRGILEAQQQFRVLNLIRIPTSIFLFAGPLLVLPFSHSLVPVVLTLIAGRLIGCAAQFIVCLRCTPALRHKFALDRSIVLPVVKFGGWMTVTNVVGPATIYADRFIIGAVLSVMAVSYYTVPFDVVSRLTLIPGSIAGVLFPAFALSVARKDGRAILLLGRGLKYVFLIIFPISLVFVTLAPELLRLWLGASFAQNSGAVLRWLAAGIFINCLSVMPFTLLQGIGYPEVTGKFVILDILISVPAEWFMTVKFGILGAAVAMTVRTTLETLVLFALSHHYLTKNLAPLKSFVATVAVAFLILYAGTLPTGLVFKAIFLLCTLLAFACVSWLVVLRPEERSFVMQRRTAGASHLTELRLWPITRSHRGS